MSPMSLWRPLARGLRVLTNRANEDRALSDELSHYFDQAEASYLAAGLSRDDARRAAQREVGNLTAAREQVRSSGWEHVVDTLMSDVRYSMRRLRAAPAFTTISVLTLALGVGASTAIFSAVNPVLLQPLPYLYAHRLVSIWSRLEDGQQLAFSFGNYRELVARARSFDALAVARPWGPTLTGPAQPERFAGERVSASYFRVFGAAPAFGRDFLAEDDRPGGAALVILSDGLWRRRFGADSAIVGHQIILNDVSYTVIGVMPPRFENVPAPASELWTLLQYELPPPGDGPEWGHNLRLFARLRTGVSLDDARRELATIAGNPVAEFARPPWSNMRSGFLLDALKDEITGGIKPALLAVFGAVALLLLIACVNVTNLLLARTAQRRGEMAMRAALGAERSRLVRQLLTESVLLSFLGGALGLLVAEAGVHALVVSSPADLPRLDAIRVNAPAFAFAFAVSVVVGIAVGLVPALQTSHGDLAKSLQRSSRRAAGGNRLLRSTLVVAEVALALVLLVSAGLLMRSVRRLLSTSPGFASANVLTMEIRAASRRFDDSSATIRFFADVLRAAQRVPGVTAAALTSQLPLSGDDDEYGAHFEDSPTGHTEGETFRYAVTPDYFTVMHIPLRRGRLLSAADRAGAPLAMVINESFARRKYPGQSALGKHVHIGADQGPWYTIVGVVGDVKQLTIGSGKVDAAYITPQQSVFADRTMSLVVHANGNAAALAPAIRSAVWSVDKDQPISRVSTMDALVAASEARRRFALVVFEAFAIAALILAATGIYGVISGGVVERRREIGVRSALGAAPGDIRRLIVRQGVLLAVAGVVIGLGGGVLATGAISSLLFDVSRLDPLTYAAVATLLVGVAVIASWIPARRAAGVDPTITLRAE